VLPAISSGFGNGRAVETTNSPAAGCGPDLRLQHVFHKIFHPRSTIAQMLE
jgi:hypothetical protein